MEDEDVSDLLQVKRVHSGGKRTFDRASKERLVRACLLPGVSVSKLALENNVNANQLRKWIRKYRLSQQGSLNGVGGDRGERLAKPAFIPVIAAQALEGPDEDLRLVLPKTKHDYQRPEMSGRTSAGSGAQLSATLPNGVTLTLELTDASVLVSMIGALGHVPSVG